jgi:1-deoxy-D-xylulose-5-phosphate reductoisomerase
VEFVDRSVLAQLGLPDMRVPIAVALAHPERIALDLPSLDLAALSRLDFEAPDRKRFPCLDLAFRALAGDEAAPAVLNAANEVSVAAFLDGAIPLPGVAGVNGATLEAHLALGGGAVESLDTVVDADAWARGYARDQIEGGRWSGESGDA